MKTIMIIVLVNSIGLGYYETKEFNSLYSCKKQVEKLKAMPENVDKDYYCVQGIDKLSGKDYA